MAQLLYSILGLLLTASAAAQSIGLPTMWQGARAAIVRDTIYFDGGLFGTQSPQGSTNIGGLQSQLNLSTPFDSTTNFSALLPFTNYTENGPPPHISGFMFANNDEWYSFGGVAYPIAHQTSGDTDITWDGIYQSDPISTGQTKGAHGNWQPTQDSNFTQRHITNGAGVNVPSEKLSFYFSGLRSVNNTDMTYGAGTRLGNWDYPSQLVNTMLMVNSGNRQTAVFSEIAVPNGTARAEAVLAWLPIGARGAVIVIGGVPYPAYLFGQGGKCALNSNYTTLNSYSSSTMTNLSIYDVGSGSWYTQQTNGDPPPQLAQACAVVASAPDNSSHSIYVYGGYPGNVNGSIASDDVWILSVPAFTWIRVASQDSNHGRIGHVCAKPYPDQMMVIGGATTCGNKLNKTVFADVFNLTSLTWTNGTYNASLWSSYTVPSSVSKAISTPTAAGMNTGLLALFQTAYSGKEPQYYPYPVIPSPNATVNGPNTTISSTPAPGPTPNPPKPGWLIPVAVVIPVVGVIFIALGVCLCIRRKRKDASGRRESRVISWIRGQPAGKSLKSEDETTQIGSSPGPHEIIGDSYFKRGNQSTVAELNGGLDPALDSGFSSPTRHPHSPGSNATSAELHSHSVPAELPSDMRGIFTTVTPKFRDHHMYPPSLGGHDFSGHTKSVSSPNTDLADPRGRENTLDAVPDDIVLDQVQSGSPRVVTVATSSNPPHIATTAGAGGISPELTSAEYNDIPITPPPQHARSVTHNTSGMVHRPFHTRNTSSMSSGITDVSSTSPADRQQRSTTISPILVSPSTIGSINSPVQPSQRPGIVPEGQVSEGVGLGIKRKEVGTSTLPKTFGSGTA